MRRFRVIRCVGWQIERISRNLLANFEVFISRGPNRKMVGEFCIICRNVGFSLLWGDAWIFGIYHLREWREFCVIHNLK